LQYAPMKNAALLSVRLYLSFRIVTTNLGVLLVLSATR